MTPEQKEIERLKLSVKRLSYLAVDKGYGVWRCVKCDTRYTTLPRADAVCGESVFTERGSVSCHGKLEPYAPEASDRPESTLRAALRERDAEHGAVSIRVGVAVLVRDGAGRVLLGRRAKEPNRGKWVIPGGGIEHGECWQATGAREVREETGLTIDLADWPCPYVLEIIDGPEHRVILCAQAKAAGGELHAGGDLLEVRFFDPDALPADISPAVVPALEAFGFACPAPLRALLEEAGK